MTRPMTLPNGLWGVMVVLCAITACDRADDRPGTDTPRGGDEALTFRECDTTRVVTEASRADIVSWARDLDYQPVDTTRAYIRGVPSTATSPSIQAAGDARRRPRAVLQRGCIIGRVVSTAANASLGVAAGTNYIWADSGSSGWRVVIIPEMASAALRLFEMRIHDHTGVSRDSSALAIVGPCVECERAGWCRWPTADSARVTR